MTSPETQILEVWTNRMKKLGIKSGDLVVVDPSIKPKPGDMVAREEEDGIWRLKKALGVGKEEGGFGSEGGER